MIYGNSGLIFNRKQTMKFIVITISLGFFLSPVAALSYFTPKDVRFANFRCQEITTSNETLRNLWRSGILPDENRTHCFVKCVLRKLGLINLKDLSLDATKICDQFGICEPNRKVVEDWLNTPLNGTCLSYFKKWMQLERYFFQNTKHLFYRVVGEDPTDSDNKMFKCEIAVEISATQDFMQLSYFECEDYCIFKNLYFFDAYGRVDQNEIATSFREAGRSLKDYDDKLLQCVHFANSLFSYGPCRMAIELRLCLVRELPKAEYVFDYRNNFFKDL